MESNILKQAQNDLENAKNTYLNSFNQIQGLANEISTIVTGYSPELGSSCTELALIFGDLTRLMYDEYDKILMGLDEYIDNSTNDIEILNSDMRQANTALSNIRDQI